MNDTAMPAEKGCEVWRALNLLQKKQRALHRKVEGSRGYHRAHKKVDGQKQFIAGLRRVAKPCPVADLYAAALDNNPADAKRRGECHACRIARREAVDRKVAA